MASKRTKNAAFRIRSITATDHGFTYKTFQVVGYLNGERVRKKFKCREEALGEKNRLEVAAANGAGEVRPVNTRLDSEQVRTAETLFALTPDPLAAVQWYLANYRPAVAEIAVEFARDAFIADRTPHISKGALRDYARTLKFLCEAHPKKSVHAFAAADVEACSKITRPAQSVTTTRGATCMHFLTTASRQ